MAVTATLNQTRTHNAVNEITGISGGNWMTPPTYDAAGNMTAGPWPGNETATQKYVYDAWNRLSQVKDGSDALVAEYRYDGLNHRIAKIVVTGTGGACVRTDFYYNESWQVLEERRQAFETLGTDGTSGGARGTLAGPTYAQYVWDLRYIDAPVLRWRNSHWDTDENNGLDETMYYCNDANMNVTALVDATSGSATEGQVVERYLYDPYGSVTVCDSAWTPRANGWFDEASKKNEILYCGYRFDPETGMYQARFRYYQPTMGQWVSRDPIDYADGMGLYDYVGSSPEVAADALGLWGSEVHYTGTLKLAKDAHIACPDVMAQGANAPDSGFRKPGMEGMLEWAALRVLAAKMPQYRDIFRQLARMKWRAMAEWHFPVSENGMVEAGSDAARDKARAGLNKCDIVAFSEGLHVLQDSYSHQGKPFAHFEPGEGAIGHGRGAEEITVYQPITIDDLAFGNGSYQSSVAYKTWVYMDPEKAATSTSADDPTIWPEDARAAMNDSYKMILSFKKKCKCACPGTPVVTHGLAKDETHLRPNLTSTDDKYTSEGEEAEYWNQMYPGKNKVR
jgi:RHS repeat-associated protein